MLQYLGFGLFYFANFVHGDIDNSIDTNVIKMQQQVFWANAVIPFYIEPEHFDHEQSLSIMTSLSLFAFKTCLKFSPVLVRPKGSQHVMVFENPKGIRKCIFNTDGHSVDEPHRIILGYGCLKSPQIDMMMMRALGFSFEHNRANRDLYIDVQFENIDPGALELFTKNSKLPPELRTLRYDFNSVTHFGDRDYSKNGHRTILFKDHNVQQNRKGLSDLDVRKIEIVYGPECLKRDRQEKIDLCQNYPGVARRKREIDLFATGQNLRVNREITAPPEINLTREVENTLHELGIENEVQEITDRIYKISSLALNNARGKYCNVSIPNLRTNTNLGEEKTSDVLGIVEVVTDYAKSIVDHTLRNLTAFCETSNSIDQYQRARCSFFSGDDNCRISYRSTKTGRIQHSTQHRPTYYQSTKHSGKGSKNQYHQMAYRSGIDSENVTKVRRRREADVESVSKKSIESDSNTESLNRDMEVAGKVISIHNWKTKNLPKTTAKMYNIQKTTNSSQSRRRFQNSPFSIYNRMKSEEESDLSLEAKKEVRISEKKPVKKNFVPQKRKNRPAIGKPATNLTYK